MSFYATSDTHFGHRNIIKYSGRPDMSVEEHDEMLIDKWNAKVPKGGTVYHLGDVFFGTPDYFDNIIRQLNFGALYVIEGNHDRSFSEWFRSRRPKNIFFWPPYYQRKVGNDFVVMSHYPIREWNRAHHGAYHLFGHVHGNHAQRNERSMDVGVDTNDYSPYSWEEIQQKLESKPYLRHH